MLLWLLFHSIHASFLHITDIHVDPSYVPGAQLENGCHYLSEPSLQNPPAGKYGAPLSSCDSPLSLVNETFGFIFSHLEPLDFVIWTGDNARHDTDVKMPRTMDEIKKLNILIRDYMLQFKNIPVLPSIGTASLIFNLKEIMIFIRIIL